MKTLAPLALLLSLTSAAAYGETLPNESPPKVSDTFISGVVFRLTKAESGFRLSIENRFPKDIEFVYTGPLTSYSFHGKNGRGEIIKAKDLSGGAFMRTMITLKPGEVREDDFKLAQLFEGNDVPNVVSLVGTLALTYEGAKMALPFELAVPRE